MARKWLWTQEPSTDVYRIVNYSNSRVFGNSGKMKVQPLLLLPAKSQEVRIGIKGFLVCSSNLIALESSGRVGSGGGKIGEPTPV